MDCGASLPKNPLSHQRKGFIGQLVISGCFSWKVISEGATYNPPENAVPSNARHPEKRWSQTQWFLACTRNPIFS